MRFLGSKPFLWSVLISGFFLPTTLPGVEIDQAIRAEIERFNQRFETPDLDTTAKAVLELVKLDYPGLEQVKAACETGDYDHGIDLLLAYFKHNKNYIDLGQEETQTKYDIGLAEQTLNHVIKGNKNYDPAFRGTKIDWVGKAVIGGEVIHDVEWLYHFHRLYWWTFLAKAYEETGDEAFFYEWRYELVNYADDLLPITENSIRAVSRGMETYYRCDVAMKVLPVFIKSRLFDAKLLRIYIASFHHQAEHIRKVYADGGNHLLGEVTHVFNNGLFFPELKSSDDWIRDGLTLVPELMKEMIYEEGMNKELVFSYHIMYCDLFYNFYIQARDNGYADRLPASYYETLKRLHDIKMIALLPDGSTVQFGDAWKYGKKPDGTMGPRYADWIYETWNERFPEEEHYVYLATDGVHGKAWDETCFRYDQSGFHFFRNEWSPDAIYLAMKYGPNARAHNQPDNGTFSLAAYGRDLMIDSGSYVYESEDPEEQYWRDWFRRSSSHQTLTLDYENLQPDPDYLVWHDSDELTAAVTENQSYDGLAHRRTVLFLDKEFFVIYDEAKGQATGDVRVHFQLNTCDPLFTENGTVVDTNFETGPNLLLKAFPQTTDWVMEKEEGWVSYLYKHKQERPAFAYLTPKTDGRPVTFLTVLMPVDGPIEAELISSLNAVVSQPEESRYEYTISKNGQTWKVHVDAQAGSASGTSLQAPGPPSPRSQE
jgi:heparan-sulfate lyase